jgi:predicted transglutaminase-like cysteine proteinase
MEAVVRNLVGPMALALVVAVATPSLAMNVHRPSPDSHAADDIAFGNRVVAPFAAIMFCHRYPIDCEIESPRDVVATEGKVVLTAQIAARIDAVNRIVNRSIVPQREQGPDVWQVSWAPGDCDEFALTKRDLLIRTGLPSSAVLVATAMVPDGEMHAVLIVRTDKGAVVLDNLDWTVRSWRVVAYRWDKIQSPEDPRVWLKF